MQSEYLEFQYRPWPDPQKIVARWASWSHTYLEQPEFVRNIAYGAKPTERLDILRAEGVRNAPVLVFIHGGYWQRLDKDHYAFALKPIVDSGVVVANINYTLCPAVTMDELIDEVRTACSWLWDNVSAYGGNPERVHVAGHSAGGHLSAMMATTEWPSFDSALPPNLVKSATPISGLFDLEPLRQTSINDAVQMDRETAKRNSPVFFNPATPMPLCIVVGGSETPEFHQQSKKLADAWHNKVQTIEYIDVPDQDHFTIIEGMTNPEHPLACAIRKQVGLPS